MGGAAVAAMALRDAERPQPRVRHLFLLDPWLDQQGVSPLSSRDMQRPLGTKLRSIVIWLNGAGQVGAASEEPAQRLVQNARQNAEQLVAVDIVRAPAAGHYAQVIAS